MPKTTRKLVRKSILCEDHIEYVVKEYYGKLKCLDCNFFVAGRNDTYILNCDERLFYFRVYRAFHRTEEEIECELEALRFLSYNGLNVCTPVCKDDGRYTIVFDAPEGKRIGVLFEEVEGLLKKNNLNPADSALYGEICGKLHGLLDGYKSVRLDRPHYDIEYLLHKSFSRIKEEVLRHSELRFLGELYLNLSQKVPAAIADTKPNWGLCHGDLNSGNVRFDGNKVGLLDFDDLCFSWRIYDVSGFLWDLYYPIRQSSEALKARRMACYRSFIHGYTKMYALKPVELDLAKYFVLVRNFWLLGLHVERMTYEGKSKYMGHYINDTAYNIKLQLEENGITL